MCNQNYGSLVAKAEVKSEGRAVVPAVMGGALEVVRGAVDMLAAMWAAWPAGLDRIMCTAL